MVVSSISLSRRPALGVYPKTVFGAILLAMTFGAVGCAGGDGGSDEAADENDEAADENDEAADENGDEADDGESTDITDDEVLIDEEGSSSGGDGESAAECARDPYVAERSDVNVYLLLDISGSMDIPIGFFEWPTLWDAVREAAVNFIEAPTSAGLNLALNYYPTLTPRVSCEDGEACEDGNLCVARVCSLQLVYFNAPQTCLSNADCTGVIEDPETGELQREICTEPRRCDDDPNRLCLVDGQCTGGSCNTPGGGYCPGTSICDESEYSSPAVDRQHLPEGADVLVSSLRSNGPDSFATTPTQVALRGAYSEVARWIEEDPDTQSIVVLATDGVPQGCNDDAPSDQAVLERSVDQTLTALEDGEAAGIDTYVVSVLPDLTDAADPVEAQEYLDALEELVDVMAEAGGTGEAYDVTIDDTEAQAFRDALDAIRGQVLPCEYDIPEPSSGALSFDRLNVEFTTGGETDVVPKVDGAGDCGSDQPGWYYNASEMETPTKVVLCPATCSAANSASGNRIDIVLGCQTVTRVR
jgi:hypothetical protein